MLRHSNTRAGLVGALFAAGLLCALPAQGQVIEEGYPTKPVFPEEPPAAPYLHEECGPFLDSVQFAEECAGDNGGPGVVGGDSEGIISSGGALDPAFPTPPRLECPSAVFLEELETGAIDCHGWDAAGEEHLAYRWEPIGGATRDYLENPRLIPEDAPNPMVVAPSSPQYEALETFLSEEGTQRYRYRLTATSRATGLSSWSEVEVFVLSSRPEVYCPLEVTVEEGATAPLACEGADPLSFRMDGDAGDAPVLWEWEGLWGASTAPLTAADTPQPLFTAPPGSAGATYHYVASMTTHSSGVARTARRRVSVTVTGSETANNPAPEIACTDFEAELAEWGYDEFIMFDIHCEVTNEPADATYSWDEDENNPEEGFLEDLTTLKAPFYADFGQEVADDSMLVFQFTVTLSAPSLASDVTEDVTVTLLQTDNFMTCNQKEYTVYAGSSPDFSLNCTPDRSFDDIKWVWEAGPLSSEKATTGEMTKRLSLPHYVTRQNFDPVFSVPDALPAGKEIDIYQFFICIRVYIDLDYPGVNRPYETYDSEYVTVTVKKPPEISVECTAPDLVYEGAEDVDLTCEASGAPEGSAYSYAWKASGSTPDTDLLSAEDILSPKFETPETVDADKTYDYMLTVTAEHALPDSAEVTVTVKNKLPVAVTCEAPDSVYEGAEDVDLTCKASGAPEGSAYSYAWKASGSTPDTDLLSAEDILSPKFETPETVDADKTYDYMLTVTAEHALPDSAEVTVTVKNKLPVAVTCEAPDSVYEGAEDVDLTCKASGAPEGSAYSYAWKASGSTPDTDLLSAEDILSPKFETPETVDADKTYDYMLTVTAEHALPDSAEVTVTVKNKLPVAVTCEAPDSVYEGAEDVDLTCKASGAPEGSAYSYAWKASGSTPDTDLLSAKDILSPRFETPEAVDADKTYDYMLTVTAANALPDSAEVTVQVLDKPDIVVTCTDPDPVYEGAGSLALACTAEGAPGDNPDYAYAWTPRNTTPDTLLSATDILSPTFASPENVDVDETYEYTLTVSAENAEDGAGEVTVRVLNKPNIVVACTNPNPVYEGAEDLDLSCEASGAPDGSSYAYAWSVRNDAGGGEAMDLLTANATGPTPTFAVPANVSQSTKYEYMLMVSAENAEDGTDDVTVTVLNEGAIALACSDPGPVYEGSDDIALSCSASGAPGEAPSYSYAWSPRSDGGSPGDAALLSATNISSPTFDVPNAVSSDATYGYSVQATAANAEAGTADVTVTVLDKPAIVVRCAVPDPVYEGSDDISLACNAYGAPSGSSYSYAWSSRNDAGSTGDTALLSATNISSPTFAVSPSVSQTMRYEYLLTVTAANAEAGTAKVSVTVLNKGALALSCTDPAPVYAGSEDITLSCAASGAPSEQSGSAYEYVWTGHGATANTALLSARDVASPVFSVPEGVSQTTAYEYFVTVSAANAEDATAEVTVTVLDNPALALSCANPDPVYEGSPDFALDCAASGAPEGSAYEYVWTSRGSTADTGLLSAADVASPSFSVPADVSQTTAYEYFVTVSAEHAEDATAEVTVTVLNTGALALACRGNPYSAYEGSGNIALDCAASGAPEGSAYEYVWTSRGSTADTGLLSAADVASPSFSVPDSVGADETYEYLLTVSAEHAEAATAEVTVTVLDRIEALPAPDPVALPDPDPVTPPAPDPVAPEPDPAEPAEPAEPLPPPVAEATPDPAPDPPAAPAEPVPPAPADPVPPAPADPVPPAPDPVALSADPSALGMRVGVSRLRFGVQSSDTQVSLDPLTDRISTSVSGPYHAGRLTLSSDGDLSLDENGDLALSIELVAPVLLRREGAGDAPPLALRPTWSMAASCAQRASQSIRGLRTQATLSESDCRLLLFGGAIDLSGAVPGRYSGNIDVILRTASGEETHSIEAAVEVVSGARVILAGAGGVRFGSSREVAMGLLEEQTISIYPNLAYLTRDNPSGAFELSNPSLVPVEVSVSARYGYAEATEDGRERIVEDSADARLGDLSEALELHPRTLTLMPGERGVVRYRVREEALSATTARGYAAFFEIASAPRQYVRADWLPEAASEGKTARVTMRVPAAYAPSEDAAQLSAELLSAAAGPSPSATFLVATDGAPFLGEVAAYDAQGRELGRSRTLVYTRSRVRVPLDRLPEGGAVFLRFVSSRSGQASKPVSVPWTAMQRSEKEIGAAMPLKK